MVAGTLGWWQGLVSAMGQEHSAVQVRDVMTEVTVTDSATDTLQAAAERMWRQQTGSLLPPSGAPKSARRLCGVLAQ
jgi:hypothetical protein